MKRLKVNTPFIRTSSNVKQLSRAAAKREHRSVASMVAVLVLEYMRKNELQVPEQEGRPSESSA